MILCSHVLLTLSYAHIVGILLPLHNLIILLDLLFIFWSDQIKSSIDYLVF